MNDKAQTNEMTLYYAAVQSLSLLNFIYFLHSPNLHSININDVLQRKRTIILNIDIMKFLRPANEVYSQRN